MKKLFFLLLIISMILLSQISFSQSDLSSEDIKYIKELKEKHLWPDKLNIEDVTPEILDEIRTIVNQMESQYKANQQMEMREPLTANELTQLDNLLRSKWNSMRNFLSRGEIERAITFFSKSSRSNYRNILNAYSKNECKQLAQDLKNIKLISEMGDTVEYDLRRSINGNTLSFQLIFVKDVNREWYIKSF